MYTCASTIGLHVTDIDIAGTGWQDVTISTSNGVKVDFANVIKADIETSNGVIHVIDAVMLPKSVAGS